MKAAAPWIIAAVAAVVVVASLVSRARALGAAEVSQERADALASVVAQLRVDHDATEAALAAEREARAAEREARAAERAESARRIAQATARASEVASDLRARLDSVGTALLAQYEAEMEARDAERLRVIASLEEDVRSLAFELEAERGLSLLRLEGWDASRSEVSELRAANASLRDAVAPSFFTSLTENWELVALGTLLGAVTWEIAR